MEKLSKEKMEYFVWAEDKSWYELTKDYEIVLTDKAPLKARISYKKWKEKYDE